MTYEIISHGTQQENAQIISAKTLVDVEEAKTDLPIGTIVLLDNGDFYRLNSSREWVVL